MKTRILTSIVAILIFIPFCVFSDTVVFPIGVALISVIGVYEMAKCVGFNKRWGLTVPMYLVAAFLPILRYLVRNFSGCNRTFLGICLMAFFAILIYSMSFVMFGKNKDKLTDVLSFFALFVYIVGCFTSLLVLRWGKDGAYMYLLAFLGAWICDIFAYFVGKFFGKHKLIPEISPKKTIEGSIGGIIFTILGFIVYGLIVNNFFSADLSLIKLAIFGFVLSIVSQIGDLLASTIKRQYGIKDYGTIFPGHGGILDRFDSVMLVAPCLFVLNFVIV